MSVSLSKVQRIVEKHLLRELDIMEMVLKLSEKDVKIFLDWYINHPYRKNIEKVVKLVKQFVR